MAGAATTSDFDTMETMPYGKSWIEVSQAALESNFAALRHVAGSERPVDVGHSALLAVIKADGYGHGATLCAPVLARSGAEWLGVTDATEGAAVRNTLDAAGISGVEEPQLLVMCGLESEDVPLLVQHRLTPVVWFSEQLAWIAAHADVPQPFSLHVEIDTGMARQGARPGEDLAELLQAFRAYPQLKLDGVMTHFVTSEVAGAEITQLQQHRFEQALEQVRAAGEHPVWLHAGNTSTLDEARLLPWLAAQARTTGARLLARSGLALYGYTLPLEGDCPRLSPLLTPVGAWKSHVIAVRDLAPGETVGYNATFTARQPMRVALLPVGYADGLRRELSGSSAHASGWVMLRGQRAPILGRVSMNLTTVDVTKTPTVTVGDVATLLGPGISAEDHARLAGTIPYEILCGLRAHSVLVA